MKVHEENQVEDVKVLKTVKERICIETAGFIAFVPGCLTSILQYHGLPAAVPFHFADPYLFHQLCGVAKVSQATGELQYLKDQGTSRRPRMPGSVGYNLVGTATRVQGALV